MFYIHMRKPNEDFAFHEVMLHVLSQFHNAEYKNVGYGICLYAG